MANTSKQAKRAAASKAKKKVANIQRQKKFEDLGRRDAAADNKALQKLGRKQYQQAILEAGFDKTDGYTTALKRFRKMSKEEKQEAEKFELTNKEVLNDIDAFIGPLTHLHAGIDVYETLAAERRFEYTDEQKALFTGFDQLVTEVLEDIFGIYGFMENDKEPEDYMMLYSHMGDRLMDMAENYQQQIIAVLEVQKEAMDQYAHEHRGNTPMLDYMRQLHELRMLKVGPKFATQRQQAEQAPLHSYTPDNPQPLDEPADFDQDEPESSEPLVVEPDLVKDVEAAQPQ